MAISSITARAHNVHAWHHVSDEGDHFLHMQDGPSEIAFYGTVSEVRKLLTDALETLPDDRPQVTVVDHRFGAP